MGGEGFAGTHQLFHQRVAKQHQLSLCPQRAVRDEQAVPVASQQQWPQNGRHRRWGQQQRTVFVKQGDGIAHRPTHGAHTLGRYGLGLQAVEYRLGLGKAQPYQAIEHIVQVVAGGHLGGAADECLVRLARRGGIGGAEPHGAALRGNGGVQCVGCGTAAQDLLHHLAHTSQWLQPGPVPVHCGQVQVLYRLIA